MVHKLEIKELQKTIKKTNIIKGISLDVKSGEVVVLLGPSGCGKSTTLRCINGLEQIYSGQIVINGETIDKNFKDWQRIRQKVGMVFQSYELFDHMNVIENVLLGPLKVQGKSREEAEKTADMWLKRVGLIEKKYAYPKELSGGQKQRIAIVRSLCLNPEIMLFDEVTAALDPEIVREVLDVIINLAREGMTMLIVTHEMSFARAVANRIVFMDAGEIVEISEPELFFTQPQSDRAKKFLNLFSF